MKMLRVMFMFANWSWEIPVPTTIPNVMQRMAATMGWGMEATMAPNLPKRPKKIMKAEEIWITRRLPTRVKPTRPAFSLRNKTLIDQNGDRH